MRTESKMFRCVDESGVVHLEKHYPFPRFGYGMLDDQLLGAIRRANNHLRKEENVELAYTMTNAEFKGVGRIVVEVRHVHGNRLTHVFTFINNSREERA